MEISTCRTPWRVLIANGRFLEENYRRAQSSQSKKSTFSHWSEVT